LAVGILLGAGPLKEPIETSLADQVSSLRDDKLVLRDQLEAATTRGDYADDAFRALLPQAASGLLTGRGVALVEIGEQSETRLEDVKAGLEAAGAELAAEIRLEDGWAAGADESRAEVARAVAELLGPPAGESLGDRDMIAAGLAAALKGGEDRSGPGAGGEPGEDSPSPPAEEPSPPPDGGGEEPSQEPDESAAELAESLWAVLAEGQVASGTVTGSADAVLVLTGPYIEDPAKIAPDTVTTGRREPFVGVISALVGAGLKTVVCGPDQAETDLVRRLRADESFRTATSTVAAPLPAAEAVTALWALAASFHSVVGAYGMSGAEAELPPYRPAPAPGQGADAEDNGDGEGNGDGDGGAQEGDGGAQEGDGESATPVAARRTDGDGRGSAGGTPR
jgi:hypothetical protein